MNMWAAHVLKGIAALPSKTKVCNTLQTSRWTFFKWALNQAILCLTKSKFSSLLPVQLREKSATQNRKPRNWIPIHMLALKVIFTPTCLSFARLTICGGKLLNKNTQKFTQRNWETIKEHAQGCDMLFGYVLSMFVHFCFMFGSLEDSLPSFKSVALAMIHGSHNQLKTNKQQQTTTNHQTWPKSAIKCFSPWIYEHATPKSWNFGPGSDVFPFFNWVILLRFQPPFIFRVAPTSYHSLAPRGKRFFMQKTQGGWPRRICGAGYAMGIKKRHLHQGISGWAFSSPRIPREHNRYHGYTARGTPNCPLTTSELGIPFLP